MFKKLTAMLLAFIILLSALPIFAALDYDEEGAYWECYMLYPDFVDKIKANGVTDSQIIKFLGYVEKHLLTKDEDLNEENFDDYMFDAVKYAFDLRPNISIRNAIIRAYPQAVTEGRKGIVPKDFIPIYETVKRFLFGLKTPVITVSATYLEVETVIYAHSLCLPENCSLILAVYDEEGALLHTKALKANVEEDGIHCTCGKSKSAKVFAWDKSSLAPICNIYELTLK